MKTKAGEVRVVEAEETRKETRREGTEKRKRKEKEKTKEGENNRGEEDSKVMGDIE